MEQGPEPKPPAVTPAAAAPQLVVIASARQRLEDKFRQSFLEQHRHSDLVTALHLDSEPAATINGRK